MRIGITGASGFLGSALGKLAAKAGHRVVAFSRSGKVDKPWVSESRVLRAAQPDKPLILNQPQDFPTLDASGCDVLVHLAGEPLLGFWTRRKKDLIWRSRVDLTKAIVAALAQPSPRPRVLLCASGVGYYGSRGDELLDESSARGGGFLSDLCGEWEAAVRGAERQNARVVLLRTGFVLGHGGGAFPLMKRIFRLGLGGRLGDGRQWMSWIHLEDHARLMLWCIENAQVTGPVNLVAPNPVTNRELTATLARCLKRPAFFHAPAFALRLLIREMADEMLLASQRAAPRVALDLGFEFRHTNLAGAFSNLLSG